MARYRIFVLRLILSVVFAYLVSSLFFGRTTVLNLGGLALIFLGLAYGFEYLKTR